MFDGDIHALRAPERLKKLEVEKVVELSLEQLFVTKVLDIGTGTGVFAESFSLRNINVTAIDTNPDMLSAASKLVTNVNFKEASAEKLPFDDKSFDIVFMGLVLHECTDPAEVLKEAYRVASSRVVILEWPYCESDAGPTIAERFRPEGILKMAKSAKFKNCGKTLMSNFILYRLNF